MDLSPGVFWGSALQGAPSRRSGGALLATADRRAAVRISLASWGRLVYGLVPDLCSAFLSAHACGRELFLSAFLRTKSHIALVVAAPFGSLALAENLRRRRKGSGLVGRLLSAAKSSCGFWFLLFWSRLGKGAADFRRHDALTFNY